MAMQLLLDAGFGCNSWRRCVRTVGRRAAGYSEATSRPRAGFRRVAARKGRLDTDETNSAMQSFQLLSCPG